MILTDSQAAIQTVLNMGKGSAPRSGIESSIMERLAARKQQGRRTRIAWVKAHAGVPGNEKVDGLAKSAAALRLQRNGTEVVTSAGLREVITATRKRARDIPGFGRGQRCRGKWGREAITAYTQLRTNARPFRAFLASERGGRKVRSDNCLRCKANVAETGDHIVFECKDRHRSSLRRRYIAGARTWEDLDRPRHKHKAGVGDAPAQEEDLVETFFSGMLRRLAEQRENEEGDEDEEEVEEVEEVVGAQAEGDVAQAAGEVEEAEDGGMGGDNRAQEKLARGKRGEYTFLGVE